MRTPLSPCPHRHPGGQPVPSHPTALWASCFPCFLPCCRATASTWHRPWGGSGWLQGCQRRLAVWGQAETLGWTGQGTRGRDRHGEGDASPAWTRQPHHGHTEGCARLITDMPAWSQTHRGTCHAGHRHRDMPAWSQIEGHATLVTDVPAWSRTHGRMCHPGHRPRDVPTWSRMHGGMCHPGHRRASFGGATPWVLQTGCRATHLQCGVQGAALGL